MKLFKNLSLVAVIIICLILTGCGSKKEANVSGSLEEIMTKIYESVPEDELPMVMNIEVNDENIEGFLGTSDIEYESILASEPMISSIAHSVILIRTKDNANVDAINKKIKENINPRKWVCVGVEEEDVIIESKGNLIIVIVVESEEVRNALMKGYESL